MLFKTGRSRRLAIRSGFGAQARSKVVPGASAGQEDRAASGSKLKAVPAVSPLAAAVVAAASRGAGADSPNRTIANAPAHASLFEIPPLRISPRAL